MRWLLGLITWLVTGTIAYCVDGDICLHPELDVDSCTIEATFPEGRQWVLGLKCKRCAERWTVKARTKNVW